MMLICLTLAGLAFVISGGMGCGLLWLSRRQGWLDAAGTESHKRHTRPVPNTGGVAIFWGVAGPMALGLIAVVATPAAWWERVLPAVAAHLPGLRSVTDIGWVVLAALFGVHLLGLIDDRRAIRAGPKLLVQIGVAAALVLLADMRVLTALGVWFPGWGYLASVVLSVLWIVAVTNAMNFLDNMDGLSGGVGAIIAGLYLAATLIGGQWFVAALAALLTGSLLGFLLFNFPPARMFMGDAGSLVLGLLLAVVSIRTTYLGPQTADTADQWYGVLMPVVLLAIPLYDLCSVTAIRLAAGKSPFTGDHNHFSHRLVRRGMSRRSAVLVIWLCTLATGLSGVMLGSLDRWQAAVVGAQTLAVLGLLAMLEWGSRREPR